MEHRAIQYQTWETAFLPTDSPSDPYRNGVLRVEITDPFGDVRWREGFWDGGVWRLRWMPLEEGPHHLRIETNLAGLPESLGVVVASAAAQTVEFRDELATSGPVRIADDRTRFCRHDGRPFFLKSATALSAAMLATDAEWSHHAQVRRAQGFNAVTFSATNWLGLSEDRYGRRSFNLENGEPDLATLSDLDGRIAALNAHGFVAVPQLFHDFGWPDSTETSAPEEWCEVRMSREQTIRVGRYLVARWGAYDLMWILDDDSGSNRLDVENWLEVGGGIFGDDAWRAPVAMNLQGKNGLHPMLRNEPWLKWIAYRSGDRPEISASIVDLRTIVGASIGNRPFVDLQPATEGWPPSDSLTENAGSVRRRAYRSLFALPPAGLGYEAFGIWSWKPESLKVGEGEPEFVPSWSAALCFEGAEQIGRIDRKISRFEWNTLVPAPELLETLRIENGDPNEPLALANSDRSVIRIYLPEGGRFSLPSLTDSYRAYWVDPRQDHVDIELPISNSESIFASPNDEDWLLELDAV